MGWKNIKDTYRITHQVTVEDNTICIGSPMVHDLARIDMATGDIQENQTFSGFLEKTYPFLLSADPGYLRQLIDKPDVFKNDITVYTFEDGSILECQCEEPGYPNVTHDGQLMYENRFSTDRSQVVAWAKKDLECWYRNLGERIERLQSDIDEALDEHARVARKVRDLEAQYPTALNEDS